MRPPWLTVSEVVRSGRAAPAAAAGRRPVVIFWSKYMTKYMSTNYGFIMYTQSQSTRTYT